MKTTAYINSLIKSIQETANYFAHNNLSVLKRDDENALSLKKVLSYQKNMAIDPKCANKFFLDNLTALFLDSPLKAGTVKKEFSTLKFSMASRSLMGPIFDEIVKSKSFDKVDKVYDIGGGSGQFCESFYKANNKAAICLDLAENEINFLRFNRRLLKTGKVLFQSFDMFNDSWSGLDHIFLSNVIHDYSEDKVRSLFIKMKDKKSVFLLEILREENDELSACYDLLMRATLRSKQYSKDELEGFANEIGHSIEVVDKAYPFTLLKLC
ncbi:MAG: hypothetical protein KC478_12120 [Bacteriovoracaceae bacterium]|nr:hypothetical protein [Bacteriovoracaceae bacterium]